MAKKQLYLYLSGENYFTYADNALTIYFDSFDSLKLALTDFSKFIDYNEYLEETKELTRIDEQIYYIDQDGNELDYMDDEDEFDFEYKIVSRSEEEINKTISKEISKFDEAYKDMLDKNYLVDSFTILHRYNKSKSDIEKIILFLKDKIEVLNLSELNLVDVIDIINNTNMNDNVSIITKYNYRDKSNKSELLELADYLGNIKNLIVRYELSPLETCILVSDLLVEREYKYAKTDKQIIKDDKIISGDIEKLANSRSITKVFKSDEIVCAGFSNLYSAILELVNINSDIIKYIHPGKTSGHMSNIVYLNDEKYDVSGIFEIDTTWRRKENEDKSYNYQKTLHNYFHFARSIYHAYIIKGKNDLKADDDDMDYKFLKTRIERALRIINLGAPIYIVSKELELVYASGVEINNKMINGSYLNDNLDSIKSYLDGKENDIDELEFVLKDLFEQVYYAKLPANIFKSALYRVKLIEHSMDKDKYPLNEELFNEAFNSRIDNKESRLLKIIFGDDFGLQLTEEQKLEIARAKLISVLHKVAQDNINKNPTSQIQKKLKKQ